VGITISCKSLPNMDRRSKTDPFCVLWDISQAGRRMRVGQTELIADNLNPEFVTEINVDYYFEMQ